VRDSSVCAYPAKAVGSDGGRTAPTVSVVIPTMNEAANLPHVLNRIPALVTELIIVDGHSTDDTVTVARALRPDARIVHQTGRGKGDAIVCGFEAATGDIVVMLDGDGSTDPAEIASFVAALLGGADLAKGSRFAIGGGSRDLTLWRQLGNSCLNRMVNVLFGTRYTDLCYGYNAFSREALERISFTCKGFEIEALITVRAACAGLVVLEVPSVEHPRLFGESNLRPVTDGLRILSVILREWARWRFARADAMVSVPAAPVMIGSPATGEASSS